MEDWRIKNSIPEPTYPQCTHVSSLTIMVLSDAHILNFSTLTMQVVMTFKMPGKVYRTAMSSIAKSHMLIASGTEDVQVRLCDISSGAFSHTLSGHRGKRMLIL